MRDETRGEGGTGTGAGAARRARSGVNLLELAIVLALITVAAAIAIPLFYARPSVTLDNAAVLMARDLRAAQNLAVHRRTDMYVQFFGDGFGYRALDGYGRPMPNPAGSGDLVRRYSGDAVFEGVYVEALEIGPRRAVRFTPDGLVPRGGWVLLAYDGETRRITIHQDSGLIEITGMQRPWTDSGH